MINITQELADMGDIDIAIDLIYGNQKVPMIVDTKLDIQNALSFINFACIKSTDNVLVIGQQIDVLASTIAYVYTPKELKLVKLCLDDNQDNFIDNQNYWEHLSHILKGYSNTKPSESYNIMSIEDTSWEKVDYYDSIITGYIKDYTNPTTFDRFRLETGEEYDVFEKLLKNTSRSLKKDGVLVILAKPCWILKAWSLIHELSLQLEYDSYRLYTDGSRHPNTILWLRLVKKEDGFEEESQKRNMTSLMMDNNVDRLYAHRNDLRFPYVELSYKNAESFVTLDQNYQYLQYFFSLETTVNLAELCEGYTACLVTPSIAEYAHKTNRNIVLFERDNRFRQKGGLPFVKYDLYTGLTKFMVNKYANKFNRVVCDPPFDIDLNVLAKDIIELLRKEENSVAYVVYPTSRRQSLVNAMKAKKLYSCENEDICIEYSKPPKLVRINGKNAIQLHKFIYSEEKPTNKVIS